MKIQIAHSILLKVSWSVCQEVYIGIASKIDPDILVERVADLIESRINEELERELDYNLFSSSKGKL